MFCWWWHACTLLALLLWPGQPCLNKNEANFFYRGSHCAICWVKHAGPLLECHDAVCLERDKSLQPVTRAVLWHYSQQKGMPLMLTNTGEQRSFTTHPLSRCQYSGHRRDISHSHRVTFAVCCPTSNLTLRLYSKHTSEVITFNISFIFLFFHLIKTAIVHPWLWFPFNTHQTKRAWCLFFVKTPREASQGCLAQRFLQRIGERSQTSNTFQSSCSRLLLKLIKSLIRTRQKHYM